MVASAMVDMTSLNISNFKALQNADFKIRKYFSNLLLNILSHGLFLPK